MAVWVVGIIIVGMTRGIEILPGDEVTCGDVAGVWVDSETNSDDEVVVDS